MKERTIHIFVEVVWSDFGRDLALVGVFVQADIVKGLAVDGVRKAVQGSEEMSE